ncbi:SUR7/Pali family protein [Ceratobasidium sp. AG-Ba]|nr:SUR7/Pali family protein [Ceratobasidium sp. AG-Ba]QRW02696.1 SUR7/Pali family protein [Ceratobasidium sp. AG-Ba]
MARVFCLPGIFFLVAALVLQILVSISLRYVPALDIARTHFDGAASTGSSSAVSELRLGVWSYCYRVEQSGDFACSPSKHGYTVDMQSSGGDNERIGASWTRGLVLHPISAAVILIALLLSLSQHLTVTLFASLMSFLAAFFVLIAFACDIALFAYLKRRASKLDNVVAHTKPGPGFWMTLASFIVLLLAGCTVCLGRRHDRRHAAGAGTGLATTSDAYATNAAAAPRPWYKRFGRNKY